VGRERVVVGMSGGVDSSVAAALLVEQGFEVVGVTLRVWPWEEPEDPKKRFGSCCSPETVDDARQVARRLGIPYYLLNTEREFDQSVIANFVAEYSAGRTPSPCVICNQEVKFGLLRRRALAWEASAVATGHYARIDYDPRSTRYLLRRGRDPRKDQSDFLWPLTQEQLKAARFPVGGLTKEEVRAMARARGLVTAEKPESQEICFIPESDYRGFLRRRAPEAFRPGPIVDRAGRVLGEHRGLAGFTVGQRRGLKIGGLKIPLEVVAKNPVSNQLIVEEQGKERTATVRLKELRWVSWKPEENSPTPFECRTRSLSHRLRGSITVTSDEGSFMFDHAQPPQAPGQSLVLYRGKEVVGGGTIA